MSAATSPHASGIGEASFFGGVLASAGCDASVGGRIDAATSGVCASVVGNGLSVARLDAALTNSWNIYEFAILVVGAIGDIGGAVRVFDVATHGAGASGPDAGDRAGCAFGLGARLGAGANTFCSVPSAVVVALAETFISSVLLVAWIIASAFECPIALSGLAVGLDAVHLACLFAGEGGGVVFAPSSSVLAVVLVEASGADLANAGEIGGVPLAFGVESASDVVRPLAGSAEALEERGVPAAARVGDTSCGISGEAEGSSAGSGLGEPFAFGVVVARLADAVAVGAGGHACAIGLDLTFAVLLAVGRGEDFTSAAAGLELTDPLAVSVSGTSGGFGDGAASARAFLTGGIPDAIRISLAVGGGGVGNRAGSLAGGVDLHALAGRLAVGGSREEVASSGARSGGGVPLASRVGLAFSRTVVVGFGADRSASAGDGAPDAGAQIGAGSLTEATAVADAVTILIDCALRSSSSAICLGTARRSAGVGAGIELAVGVACAARSGSGEDLRALGEASQARGVPLATRIEGAAVLRWVSDRALHDARSGGGDFADGRGFASGGGGDFTASSAASSVLGVPDALRIGGATNAGCVAEFAGSCAARSSAAVLTESRSNTRAVTGVTGARRSAGLFGGVPLTRLLGEAVALGGELTAGLFAGLSGVVPSALRILIAASTSGILDGAQSGASEVLLIPSANQVFGGALSLIGDGVAAVDALHGLGVPDASSVVGAGDVVFVLERASGDTLGVNPFADRVGTAGVDGGGLTAGALACLSGGVPGALCVGVASSLGGVASVATRNAGLAVVLAHGIAVAFDRVLVHV